MRILAIHVESQNRRANYHAESQLIPADFTRIFEFFIHKYHFDVVPEWFFNGLLVAEAVAGGYKPGQQPTRALLWLLLPNAHRQGEHVPGGEELSTTGT